MYVSNFHVFSFNAIKRPVISALWYALLVHLLFQPFSTISIILSSLLLGISFYKIRFFIGLLSPIPMAISLFLLWRDYNNYFPYFVIISLLWMIVYYTAIIVWRRLTKGVYEISPITNRLKYNDAYYMMKDSHK